MADGSASTPGAVRRSDADRVLIAAMICISACRIDCPDRELALWLVEEALPLASTSPRIEALRDAAEGIVAAAPHRRKRGEGALIWARACLDLDRAMARDAIRVARAMVAAG
jgi:hypothetical protein